MGSEGLDERKEVFTLVLDSREREGGWWTTTKDRRPTTPESRGRIPEGGPTHQHRDTTITGVFALVRAFRVSWMGSDGQEEKTEVFTLVMRVFGLVRVGGFVLVGWGQTAAIKGLTL